MVSLRWIAWIPPRLPGFRAGARPTTAGAFSLVDCRVALLSYSAPITSICWSDLHNFLLSLVLFQNLIDHIFGLYTIRVIWSNKKESNKLVYF